MQPTLKNNLVRNIWCMRVNHSEVKRCLRTALQAEGPARAKVQRLEDSREQAPKSNSGRPHGMQG